MQNGGMIASAHLGTDFFQSDACQIAAEVHRDLAWYDDFGAEVAGPRTRLGAGERWRLQVRVRAPRGLANPGGTDAVELTSRMPVRPFPFPTAL